MHLQDLLASFHIRTADDHLTVKAPWTQDSGIQNVDTVGRGQHNDAFMQPKAVHLDKQLIECLLTLIMAAAHTGSAASSDSVDLIDKDDTRCVLLRIRKQISNTGCADTDKHFHKVGTRDRKERHARLAGYGSGKKRFTGSGRSLEQDALRDARTHQQVLLRIFQEINDFVELFLLLVKTGNLLESHLLIFLSRHLGAVAAEIHSRHAAACLPVHHEDEDHAQKDKR